MINCQIHLPLFICLKMTSQTSVSAYNERKKVWNIAKGDRSLMHTADLEK